MLSRDGIEPKALGSSSGSWQGRFVSSSGSLYTFKVGVRFGFLEIVGSVRVRVRVLSNCTVM
jgi:hypothetical protein